MNAVLVERPTRVPLSQACAALGVNRSTVYARRRRLDESGAARTSRTDSTQPRALSPAERAQVLETLHSERYCDQPRQRSTRVCCSKVSTCVR